MGPLNSYFTSINQRASFHSFRSFPPCTKEFDLLASMVDHLSISFHRPLLTIKYCIKIPFFHFHCWHYYQRHRSITICIQQVTAIIKLVPITKSISAGNVFTNIVLTSIVNGLSSCTTTDIFERPIKFSAAPLIDSILLAVGNTSQNNYC